MSSLPNKDKFPNGIPGEELTGSWTEQVNNSLLQFIFKATLGGRTIKVSRYGNVFEVKSDKEIEWKENARNLHNYYDQIKTHDTIDIGHPVMSADDCRVIFQNRTDDFKCEGTMYRHTKVSWKDAPIEFKEKHDVIVRADSPTQTVRFEELDTSNGIWHCVWEKCTLCHEADKSFLKWAEQSTFQHPDEQNRNANGGKELGSSSIGVSGSDTESKSSIDSSENSLSKLPTKRNTGMTSYQRQEKKAKAVQSEGNLQQLDTPIKTNGSGNSYYDLSATKRCTVNRWDGSIQIDIREVCTNIFFVLSRSF